MNIRKAEKTRETRETRINMSLELDLGRAGSFCGASGIGFFDHMLNSFCVHGGFGVKAEIAGDLAVDGHHTVEDTGITLGALFAELLGDRAGIRRYGEAHAPMDESLAFAAADICGRPYLVFDGSFSSPTIGSYDTQLTKEFFRALAFSMKATLHLRLLYGENDHHRTEALFKAASRAISAAAERAGGGVLSAKGTLV